MGRSGGVAILVPLHLIITQGIDPPTHRHVHAFTQWTRARVMHLFCIYAYDISYETRAELNAGVFQQVQTELALLGRVPWVVGGDFNQGPKDIIPGWARRAVVAAPAQPTHDYGGTLVPQQPPLGGKKT